MSDPPQSPPKDVEQAAQSPEDDGQLNEAQEAQVAMEYEGVKEQDRWLPIANGRSHCLEPEFLYQGQPAQAVVAGQMVT